MNYLVINEYAQIIAMFMNKQDAEVFSKYYKEKYANTVKLYTEVTVAYK